MARELQSDLGPLLVTNMALRGLAGGLAVVGSV